MNGDALFAKENSHAAFRAQEALLRNEIDAAPEDHVLQVDDAAWTQALVERYRVDVPRLVVDGIYMERPKEIEVVVSAALYGYAVEPGRDFKVPGVRHVVHIPFEGNGDVFGIRPMSRTTTLPRARVKGNELIARWESRSDSPIDLKGSSTH
jgi:hypothetical protein